MHAQGFGVSLAQARGLAAWLRRPERLRRRRQRRQRRPDHGSGQQRVRLATVRDVGHALGQLDIGQVDRRAGQQVLQVDFDELRQGGRQAGDFQLGQHVADDRAAQLDGRRDFSVQEVQRHLGVQGLVGVHALEVHVQDLRLVGVPLNRTQQDLLFLGRAFQRHLQDGSVELFLAQGVVDLVVVEFDVQGQPYRHKRWRERGPRGAGGGSHSNPGRYAQWH